MSKDIIIPPKERSLLAAVRQLDFHTIKSVVDSCQSERELFETGIAFGVLGDRGQWGVAETLRRAKENLTPERYKAFREALGHQLGLAVATLRTVYEVCIEKFADPASRIPELSFYHHAIAAWAPDPSSAIKLAKEYGWSVRELQEYVRAQKSVAETNTFITPQSLPQGALATAAAAPQQPPAEVQDVSFTPLTPPPPSVVTREVMESEQQRREAISAVRSAQLIERLLAENYHRWFSVLVHMLEFAKSAKEGEDFVYSCLRLVAEAVNVEFPQVELNLFWGPETAQLLSAINKSFSVTTSKGRVAHREHSYDHREKGKEA